MAEPDNNLICLSDLHLGAGYSILSDSGDQASCLRLLADALHRYIPAVFDADQPPTLVLNGDILDFDFASVEQIIEGFTRFMGVMFDSNRPPLFAAEVIYLPGNHDHRIWEQMKDQALVNYRRSYGMIPDSQTTQLFEDCLSEANTTGSYLLNEVLSECEQIHPCKITLRYPNWGLRSAQHKRHLVVHHGHYVEDIYRAMSTFSQALTEHGIDDIEELEAQNGAWIDFLWSSFSSSEQQVNNLVTLYTTSQDPAATHLGCRKLARKICNYLDKHYSVSSSAKVAGLMSLEKLITSLLDASLGKVFQSERAGYQEKLSEASVQGLQWYLSRPVRRQIQEADLLRGGQYDSARSIAERPEHCRFIFGHTHKPFQSRLPVPGFVHNVEVYNSGGWVLDEYEFTSVQGAAILFVDRALNVGSLRLFDAPVNELERDKSPLPRVRVEGVDGWYADDQPSPEGDNALIPLMKEVLAQPECNDLFMRFNRAADQRARAIVKQRQGLFFDPSRSPGVRSQLL